MSIKSFTASGAAGLIAGVAAVMWIGPQTEEGAAVLFLLTTAVVSLAGVLLTPLFKRLGKGR
jgi:hypothetical protein